MMRRIELRRCRPAVCWPLALLAVLWLGGCTGLPPGIEPVRDFEPQRYLGRWYEIMRLDHGFERGLSDVTATYTLLEDGTLGVLNRGFDREACEWREAEGRAEFQADPATASLSVTFFWPFAGGYHVFALDRENYDWAVVAGPNRDYLWILARQPALPAPLEQRLVEQARALGFPVEELIRVEHGTPGC